MPTALTSAGPEGDGEWRRQWERAHQLCALCLCCEGAEPARRDPPASGLSWAGTCPVLPEEARCRSRPRRSLLSSLTPNNVASVESSKSFKDKIINTIIDGKLNVIN